MKALRDGAAVLSALLTAALVAGLASAALWQSWQGAQREMALRQHWHARWLMGGALDWAIAVLAEDGQVAETLDHLQEDWSKGLEALPAPGAAVPQPGGAQEPGLRIQISDAQAQLNVLNLLEGTSLSTEWLLVFSRLFDGLGLPPQELQTLGQGLLRASAGTRDAALGDAPLMPERVEDLLWLGLSRASVQALRPHLSVLPARTPVNLNTAGSTVLQAVLGAPAAQIEQLIERRRRQAFQSVEEAIAGPQARSEQLAVRTQFFTVRIEIERGPGWQQRQAALLQRQGAAVRVLWREG